MNWFRKPQPRPQPQHYQLPNTPPRTPPQDLLSSLPIPTAHSCQGHARAISTDDPSAATRIATTTSASAKYYLTNPQRRGVLGHISFGVHSYARSKQFYSAILAPLGVVPLYDNPILTTVGFGFDGDHEVFNIFEYSKAASAFGRGSHLAFNAPTRRAVREFWEAGCRNGGKDSGAPGVREEYGAFYYAAFILDPDGFKLEAVCQEMDGEP